MGTQTIDERSLSHIRLLNSGRPFYIYFDHNNACADSIFLNEEDGKLYFRYSERDLTLVIHSEDGPAIHFDDGSLAWVRNGLYHRQYGPAIIDEGSQIHQYWEGGSHISSHYLDDAIGDIAIYHNDDADTHLELEKRNESHSDLLSVAVVALGTVGLMSLFKSHSLKKQKHKQELLVLKR